MPTPGAGRLDRMITIESLTQTRDAEGGMVDTWTTFATSWAMIKNLSGNERSVTPHGGVAAEARTEFTIRYLSGVTAKMRVTYDGKYYNIAHVNDFEESHRFMVLTCSTGLNLGR
jgi:SPP1 family predicted phage head-tail adaptor